MTRTQTILIADRDPKFRECCCRRLKAHGNDAVTAADGLQCIELLQSLSPDLLVLDPEILWGGGRGVLAWLEEKQVLNWLKVILTDDHCAGEFPDELYAIVIDRLERPTELSNVSTFIDQIQHALFQKDGITNEPMNATMSEVEKRNRLDQAQAALRGASYAGLKQVTCRLFGDSLVLSGSVQSFFLKQLAQTLVLKYCSPVLVVENHLNVAASPAFSVNTVLDEARSGSA